MLHTVVSFFLALFSIAIVSGLTGFLVGFYDGFTDRLYNPDNEEIASVTNICYSVVFIFAIIAAIIISRKTCKKLNNRGF